MTIKGQSTESDAGQSLFPDASVNAIRLADKSLEKNVLTATQSAFPTPTPKNAVLSDLLRAIKKVDFKKMAGLPVDSEPSNDHYRLYAVKELLKVSIEHTWGLCQKNSMFYVYNGSYWIMLEPGDMKLFLGLVAVKMGIPILLSEGYKFRETLLKQFESAAHMKSIEQDDNKVLINLLNGTFEFTPEGFRLVGFRPNDFMTYQLPFAYDPEAKAPMFMKYLNEVLPDLESQNVLSEFRNMSTKMSHYFKKNHSTLSGFRITSRRTFQCLTDREPHRSGCVA